MGIRDLLQETWASLSANKGRSFLTILGIVIGIASVIAMTSLVTGMRNMLLGELGLTQARMIQIYAYPQLEDKDLKALKNAVPDYEEIAGMSYYYASITTSTKSGDYGLMGVTPNYFRVTGISMLSGREFTVEDDSSVARVAIIGRGVNLELFGDEDYMSVGQTMRMGQNSETYVIVGVAKGDRMNGQYSQIYIPAATLHRRMSGYSAYDYVMGFVFDGSDVLDVCERTRTFIAKYKNVEEDSIYVSSMKEAIDMLNTYMTGFAAVLTAIASISLFVGGIGIMNMMLTSVSERTREIGLRRSLGARTSDITQQFLSESITLCLIGGFFGLIVGFGIAMIIASVVRILLPNSPLYPAIGLNSIVVAVAVCVSIGLLFGFYPARRAAKLDPVESLRYQ